RRGAAGEVGSLTMVPLRPRVTIAPVAARLRHASDTVVGEMSRVLASSRTVGSRVPTGIASEVISRPIVAATRWAMRGLLRSTGVDVTSPSASAAAIRLAIDGTVSVFPAISKLYQNNRPIVIGPADRIADLCHDVCDAPRAVPALGAVQDMWTEGSEGGE